MDTYDFEGSDDGVMVGSGAAVFESSVEQSAGSVTFTRFDHLATGVRWEDYGSVFGQVKSGRTVITATDRAGNKTTATVEGTWGLDHELYSDGMLIEALADGVPVMWSNGETSVFLPASPVRDVSAP